MKAPKCVVRNSLQARKETGFYVFIFIYFLIEEKLLHINVRRNIFVSVTSDLLELTTNENLRVEKGK